MQWQSLVEKRRLKITCADCISLLNALTEQKVRLQDVQYSGELEMYGTATNNDYQIISDIVWHHGAKIETIKTTGLASLARNIKMRPVLLLFGVFLLIVTCYLPSRILFISVEGNTTIPTNRIIEAADQCGIRFGVSRRHVRSEKMKNALLQEIPQLQWAGINTIGCTAVISVKEKTTQEISDNYGHTVSNVVATRDGIIQNCTVYRGNSLCTVGQAVKKGQTLVSGYTDCGIVTKASCADAEIKALTFRELEVVAPTATTVRGEIIEQKTFYSLRIGKKMINLSKDSGNIDATCVKIYTEDSVQLPGGFSLPIGIATMTVQFFSEPLETLNNSEQHWLADFAKDHLESVMIAGQVISAQTDIEAGSDAYYLTGKYACVEMIGQVKYEQTIVKDDRND